MSINSLIAFFSGVSLREREQEVDNGVNAFVRRDLNEARKSINNAYINAEVQTTEERHSKELLDIVTMVIDATNDLEANKYKDYLQKIQKAYCDCKNGAMKNTIHDMRNEQALKFKEMAEKFQVDVKLVKAEEFFELAYKTCTPETPESMLREQLKAAWDDIKAVIA